MNMRFPGGFFPVPFGARRLDGGTLFTIVSRHARRVWLMIFDAPDADRPVREIELRPETHRIGDVWFAHVPGARAGMYYLYRMEGVAPPGRPNYFDPRQWLLDPYALAVTTPRGWGDAGGLPPGRPPCSGAMFPKGVIIDDDFDWGDDHPLRTPWEDTVVYEAHVRGFTAHASSGVAYPGTYRGLIEKIPYLKDLGVTAVELLPVQEFNEMEFFVEDMGRRHLRNFWGYSTLAFFAPNERYAVSTAGGQVGEFREMVKALHAAGLEVILDVVFNHTAEGGNGGPTYSFRGIDNEIYYMTDDAGRYMNYSGCGNTVNSNHPVVRSFILDCLRYWVMNMHVDGFRFDLASVLTRDSSGEILPNPPVVEQIAEAPVLRDTKIIAEAWDAAGAYQVGAFPHERWSEWNGHYRDDVRRFWRGDAGMLGALATRIAGSSDLYGKGRSPLNSINFVTCHDGFTLRDLVSYEQKINDPNGEQNADGERNNYSFNCGVEGPTDDPEVNRRRLRMQKNMLATLLISQGVPMLLSGDEMGRTQQGNNNAYCQDNDVSWVNWDLLREYKELRAFVRELIRFRHGHDALRRVDFFKGTPEGVSPEADIRWLGPEGGAPDWVAGRQLACRIDGGARHAGSRAEAQAILIIFNGAAARTRFVLPKDRWTLAWTTQEERPTPDENGVWVDGWSVSALIAK